MNYPNRSRPILKYIKLSHVLRLLTLVGVFVLPWGFYPSVAEGKTSSTEIYGPEKIFVFYALIFVVSGLVFLWMKKKYNYWTNFDVPCPKPFPVVGHTLHRFGITGHILEFYENIYYKYNGKDFCGFYEFLNPGIIVGNLELIRSITIKDFDHFANRRVFPMSKISPVANKMLSNATGKEWKEIRMAISPVFSVNKLRNLYPLVCQQGDKFVELLRQVGDKRKEIEIRELCGQFTMDTIASCAFGIECNAMDSDRATFTKMASKIFVLSPLRALKVITLLVAPSLARLSQKLGLGFVSDEFQFFQGVVSKTLLLREEMGIRRGDFLDLMKDTNKLCETTMAAQAVLFLLAGFNNIASALSFTLHLLAKHPDIQQELRQKLMTISESKDGKIVTDFEALQKLPLLDCVVKESLRLYPTDPTMERTCTKDYQIPGSKVWIRAGQKVIIPIWCIHRDPIHWDNPNDFDPNRFSNISDRDFGPYFPFGLGPRQCIGLRFVNVVVKVGLHKILTNFEVLPSQNTIHPPPLSPKCLSSVMPLNGLPLSVIPLKSKK